MLAELLYDTFQRFSSPDTLLYLRGFHYYISPLLTIKDFFPVHKQIPGSCLHFKQYTEYLLCPSYSVHFLFSVNFDFSVCLIIGSKMYNVCNLKLYPLSLFTSTHVFLSCMFMQLLTFNHISGVSRKNTVAIKTLSTFQNVNFCS